ncbi:hypothetical protein [Frigoriglobus tundricola]|uniref:Uncharacterized protein n=1 Tax=Frigoriglobus tundricola TaxID=2774151 RepID=A0A6M5Z3S3_9BACT|nr:hypothetical protein [Frigoriglobus tundricola]QJX00756.1 hypothetical protein FTUN_8388 [Frigoriglobus tundricola]
MTIRSLMTRVAALAGAALPLDSGNQQVRAGLFFHREHHYWLWRHRRRMRRRHWFWRR